MPSYSKVATRVCGAMAYMPPRCATELDDDNSSVQRSGISLTSMPNRVDNALLGLCSDGPGMLVGNVQKRQSPGVGCLFYDLWRSSRQGRWEPNLV